MTEVHVEPDILPRFWPDSVRHAAFACQAANGEMCLHSVTKLDDRYVIYHSLFDVNQDVKDE